MDWKVGDAVRIVNTEDTCPRVLGARAEIVALAEWGAHVTTLATATGNYRAAWDEMIPVDPAPKRLTAARDQGYTGDECGQCGSMKMRRNGACLLCDSCGSTSGCS